MTIQPTGNGQASRSAADLHDHLRAVCIRVYSESCSAAYPIQWTVRIPKSHQLQASEDELTVTGGGGGGGKLFLMSDKDAFFGAAAFTGESDVRNCC